MKIATAAIIRKMPVSYGFPGEFIERHYKEKKVVLIEGWLPSRSEWGAEAIITSDFFGGNWAIPLDWLWIRGQLCMAEESET